MNTSQTILKLISIYFSFCISKIYSVLLSFMIRSRSFSLVTVAKKKKIYFYSKILPDLGVAKKENKWAEKLESKRNK